MTAKSLRVISLTNKLLRYGPSLQLQERLVQDLKAGTTPDTLLIIQHAPVFTVGKRGTPKDFHTSAEELQDLGIEVFNAPRGGETTYHGPGQLVAYPILNLRHLGLGARAFVEALEDAMVHTAGCFGIQARGRVPGKTGVWVGERKLGAVGVRITHGISSHGIALNVTADLSTYRHIVPCGTPDKEVTSVLRELLRPGCSGDKGIVLKGGAMPSRQGTWQEGSHRTQQQLVSPGKLMELTEQCLLNSISNCFGMTPVAAAMEDVNALVECC